MKMRRLLWLLLLVPAVACASMLSFGVWDLAAICLAPAALGFGLEALMLYLSRNGRKWLRLLPLALLAIPGFLTWSELDSGGIFSELAAALWLILGLLGLCGWGAAWALTAYPAFQPGGREK